MGKPRLIILVRHAQSEGNKNRAIHQTVPDHRVKLTEAGHQQAREAGKRLLDMLSPTDTVQFYTSPYRRTRSTTEGMLEGLRSHPNFNKVKVYEEPRLREQDFGNFQPCTNEMTRMWHERAAYGHFFYRIPNGESAADAYDRISGFNESLWRQFADPDFPSVLVLVTHGLMTRIFLMKWYHYSVEYFEDLRNINHCEFVIMKKDAQTGKYILQNELRTWSAYQAEQKRLKEEAKANGGAIEEAPDQKEAAFYKSSATAFLSSPNMKFGGCANGCNHGAQPYNTQETKTSPQSPSTVKTVKRRFENRLKVREGGRDGGGTRSGYPSEGEDPNASGYDTDCSCDDNIEIRKLRREKTGLVAEEARRDREGVEEAAPYPGDAKANAPSTTHNCEVERSTSTH